MSTIRACREQHEELARLMAELKLCLQAGDGDGAFSQLQAFSEKLLAHLAHEDRILYPRLVAHEDEQVRLTARIYQAEMGRLGEDFEAFLGRWTPRDRILEAPDGFAREIRELLARLDVRIKREDRGLYALVERIESQGTDPRTGASQD